jgi:hypothetical protein
MSKTIGGVTYKRGDKIVFDSPQGWRRGVVSRFGAGRFVWIAIEGTSVLQKVKYEDLRPTAPEG